MTLPGQGPIRHRAARWIVCAPQRQGAGRQLSQIPQDEPDIESGRWVNAVRRFGSRLVPPHGIPCYGAGSISDVLGLLAVDAPRIVLWEVERESLVTAIECLQKVARAAPDALQLVACDDLSDQQQISLSELCVAGFVRHPEDLPRLKPMFQGYFARYRQHLSHVLPSNPQL